MNDDDLPRQALLRRWRLLLGRYSDRALAEQGAFGQRELLLGGTLDYLYGREYEARGLAGGGASLDPGGLRAMDWLDRTRKLFPRPVFERLQAQAVERYGLSELLDDPALIEQLEPSPELARTLLGLRGRLNASTRDAVREVIRKTVDDIMRRLRTELIQAIVGRRNRFRAGALKSAQNFDWRATIRANLRNYDRERRRLLIDRPLFNARVRRELPWDVILCVDQSGSMTDSVMYSAVLAGILASLPTVDVRLVAFDTRVADLTHLAHDPVEVLLTVQLGGGTDIGRAVAYCETLIRRPGRTVFVLISDFMEGGRPGPLLAAVRRLAEARVRLLGLAALDHKAAPIYDRQMGQRLSACGMEVAALTPHHFAAWLGEVMQS